MKPGPFECPQATSVNVLFCGSEECLRPHVVLYDHHGEAMASFVVPDPKPGGFWENLQDAVYKSAVLRDVNGT
jgi:hypothetical protein